ncbi:hypothetical protein EQG49_11200 [Periweissella cryptocerci]|uniref:Phage tail protein n=1 Tax=Periweissella cryptocerci TaxID=2506420 RepID=A0A4P6YW32_9LACO|nr:phage tail tube protein [Periweissella cryptocerci]QBO36973.1 hypothetical protein EQG49_11200 [Periweissella cryptocerci]
MPDTPTIFAGYAQNHKTKYYFGRTKATLFRIAGGIQTAETDFDEDSDSVAYYDDNGGTESISSGASYPFNFEGNRKYGNEAQELIRDMMTAADKTGYLVVIEPNGDQMEGPASVSKITPFGGDANDRAALKATITFDGTPADFKTDGTLRNADQFATAPTKTEEPVPAG